jgi:hypothetical protein
MERGDPAEDDANGSIDESALLSSFEQPSVYSTNNEDSQSPNALRHPIKWTWYRTKELWSQLTLSEVSGSVGDLGTLIPLTVAMARQRSIYLAPALFFAGLSNIITGYSWDVPMCVQPMKAIAAVAISEALSVEQVTAAGMWMGVFCVVLGSTQLIELVNIIVPVTVVSGLQLGVGLRLASTGIVMISDLPWVSQADCILLAILLSLLCMFWLREPNEAYTPLVRTWRNKICCVDARGQQPVGLYLLLLGVMFAAIELSTTDNENGQYDLPLQLFGAPIATNAITSITWQDWKVGLLQGAIPQLPLTTLNSVISVCCLAHQLYPEKRHSSSTTDAVVSRREVCISVGLMNLVFCPFGSMPNCHGAGGLAAQHRLGARHGASVVFLGINKVLLAIFFGASALTILDAIPNAILGIMLAIAGQELSTTGFTLLLSSSSPNDKLQLRKNTVICIVTAMVIVGLGATHYGALSGWAVHMIYGDGLTDFYRWLREVDWRHCWRKRQFESREDSQVCAVGTGHETEHSANVSDTSSDPVLSPDEESRLAVQVVVFSA